MTNALTPVLLVEDDGEQARQITAWLQKAGFEVHHSKSGAAVDVFPFKARTVSTQLVVVDLDLQGRGHSREGAEWAMRTLWPLDRSTFFVVFSKYVEAVDFGGFGKVEPNWILVKKTFRDAPSPEGPLKDDCLEQLERLLMRCMEYIVPPVRHPLFDATKYLQIVEAFQSYSSTHGHPQNLEEVRQSITRAIFRLSQLSHECASYARAGRSMSKLSVAVYGSYGRLEARADSDLEFSIFYYGRGDDAVSSELVASLWNRLAYSIHADPSGLPFEGQKRIQQERLLAARDVGGLAENTYSESIDVATFSKSFSTFPLLRNRHVQLLCETRSVFNPEALSNMKRRVLADRLGGAPSSLQAFVSRNYLEPIFSQQQFDTMRATALDWNAWKSVVYRSMNLISTRLALAGELLYREQRDLKGEEFDSLMDWLAYPGVLKLMRMWSKLRTSLKPASDEVLQRLAGLINTYADMLALLASCSVPPSEIREQLLKLCDTWSEVTAHLKGSSLAQIALQYEWLLGPQFVEVLRAHILALK